MRNLAMGFVVVALIAVGRCTGMSETQQRTLPAGLVVLPGALSSGLSPGMRVLGQL